MREPHSRRPAVAAGPQALHLPTRIPARPRPLRPHSRPGSLPGQGAPQATTEASATRVLPGKALWSLHSRSYEILPGQRTPQAFCSLTTVSLSGCCSWGPTGPCMASIWFIQAKAPQLPQKLTLHCPRALRTEWQGLSGALPAEAPPAQARPALEPWSVAQGCPQG